MSSKKTLKEVSATIPFHLKFSLFGKFTTNQVFLFSTTILKSYEVRLQIFDTFFCGFTFSKAILLSTFVLIKVNHSSFCVGSFEKQ